MWYIKNIMISSSKETAPAYESVWDDPRWNDPIFEPTAAEEQNRLPSQRVIDARDALVNIIRRDYAVTEQLPASKEVNDFEADSIQEDLSTIVEMRDTRPFNGQESEGNFPDYLDYDGQQSR